ncbi:hypothetical protein [Nocardia niwae]|uniref:Pyridoxamine 5'-phosphate oxidase putative domain-containing protein n=1 Tax=Nocardia niwae TaxID=626084 RepID=A0ABV2X7A9_9NOCA|nr:hypothetical protein [Nocardia niwae]
MTYPAHGGSLLGNGAHGHTPRRDRALAAAHRGIAVPDRPSEWHPGMLWWDASTVLVTYPRPGGDESWNTVPHLVLPVGHGRLAFRISSHSSEAGHLARERRVIVQAADWRGEPALGSRQHRGAAELLRTGPLFDRVRTGMQVKYGRRLGLARLAHRVVMGAAPYGDTVVVVTVDDDWFPDM